MHGTQLNFISMEKVIKLRSILKVLLPFAYTYFFCKRVIIIYYNNQKPDKSFMIIITNDTYKTTFCVTTILTKYKHAIYNKMKNID